ncbi:unnamed protein product [Didymodactylos carnosus]|uniref:Proteasome subunit alpha type n=1 Tax=Didymodactylos carnosus TaxID=1234261 RepID=A0A813ZGN5_9BILA|nr:unnamed protein product [Didymodactylos carnosus]CAF0899149.1 unnamed protein product [Didymodactylos carnosus]CAF3562433.1 unnamed protein product [Didymodactylos carnosus]CAF3681898.1 unnamed protein product [Didymodactylos carnosus]
MFRNQYDHDVSIWSPQGRIYQIEYAMEAVKQGAATVAVKSKTHVVLCALKRAPSELSAHQKKIMFIDDHIGVSIAGLASDARILCRFMRTECINHQYAFDKPMPVMKLMDNEKGSHLYQLCPSANYYSCKSMAIGSRSQSARTYLEKNLDKFVDSNQDELIKHCMRALRDTLPNEVELTVKNCAVAVVGKDCPFELLKDDRVGTYLTSIEGDERAPQVGQDDTLPSYDEDLPPPPAPSGDPRTIVATEQMDT